jgi:hypothetical protein
MKKGTKFCEKGTIQLIANLLNRINSKFKLNFSDYFYYGILLTTKLFDMFLTKKSYQC